MCLVFCYTLFFSLFAKDAEFMLTARIVRHKAGHHDTTVHETVAPAVVNEKITKHRHEEATTAIDREIHQDHHHTSIQPVLDREVLPEKHSHNIVGVETREHRHGDDAAVKARLEQERLQFQNTRTHGETKETHSVAPVIAGEHIHHHVHEVNFIPCFKIANSGANLDRRPFNLLCRKKPFSLR